mgnify:CR=1 FL=1
MYDNSLYHLFIFSGLSFAFSLINIVIGLQKGAERTYLYFGIISFCVGIYYFLFPFTVRPIDSIFLNRIGLIFFISAFGFFPWFIKSYTKLENKLMPSLFSIGIGLTLILYLISEKGEGIVWWNAFGHLILLGIIAYGFYAIKFEFTIGEKKSSFYLLSALIPFLLLTIDDIIYVHFNKYYFFDIPERILPFDYFFIFFMIIMVLKLSMDMQQKLLLEKKMVIKEKRWRSLLEDVELIVIGLNTDGVVNYVNPFFLEKYNYTEKDLIGKNWFTNFLPENDNREVIKIFKENLKKNLRDHFKNKILTGSGEERMISWSNVLLEDEQAEVIGTISIGADITAQESAFEEIELLKQRLEEENFQLKEELSKLSGRGEIIGKSDGIRYVIQRALQVAETDSTVLLEGETGVGKEVIANFIQQNSPRKKRPFIKINCAAIPSTLLESELFGHTKGAFTGADKNKKGMVELADEGTLFLDEIGDFPLELQPKLLRFLQEGEYIPLGSERSKKVNVRIIAATNRELLKEIEKGQFRNDLYYRLYIYPITIPALRNRVDDIPELAEHFINKYAKKHNKRIRKISKLVINNFKKYQWPGNVRELENILERAVIVSNSDTIKVKDISLFINERSDITPNHSDNDFRTLDTVERDHIISVLKRCNWQVHGDKGAANILGLNPNTLRSRMKKLNITKP